MTEGLPHVVTFYCRRMRCGNTLARIVVVAAAISKALTYKVHFRSASTSRICQGSRSRSQESKIMKSHIPPPKASGTDMALSRYNRSDEKSISVIQGMTLFACSHSGVARPADRRPMQT